MEENIQPQSMTQGLLSVAQAAQTGDIDVTLAALEQFRKSQAVRLFDVWVFGPIAMYYALKGRLNKFERFVLFSMGIGTIGYNLRNYQLNKLNIANQMLNMPQALPEPSVQSAQISEEDTDEIIDVNI